MTGGAPVTVTEPEVHLCSDGYPFMSEHFDREQEHLTVRVCSLYFRVVVPAVKLVREEGRNAKTTYVVVCVSFAVVVFLPTPLIKSSICRLDTVFCAHFVGLSFCHSGGSLCRSLPHLHTRLDKSDEWEVHMYIFRLAVETTANDLNSREMHRTPLIQKKKTCQDLNAGIGEKMPLMDPDSHAQLNLTPDKGSTLHEFGLECAMRHLEVIKDSVTTHEDLHGSTLVEGETPVRVLDLARLENALGLLDDVT